MSIHIRKATKDDLEDIYRIVMITHQKSYDSLIPADFREAYNQRYTDTPERKAAYIKEKSRLMDDPDWVFYVAEEDGVVIGFTCAQKKQGNIILKQGLFVDPRHQGKGVGGKLFAGHLATVPPGMTVRLYVIEANIRAKQMYKKYGFKEVGYSDKLFFGNRQNRMEYVVGH